MDKSTKAKLNSVRRSQKKAFAEENQRMIHELQMEGLTVQNIATETGATSVSVYSWTNGAAPSRANSELIRKVHERVMFLKSKGVKYSDLGKMRTLEAAYIEAKGEEAA